MTRTRLQLNADRRADEIRRALAGDLRRMREDAGVSQSAVARVAGTDRSVVSRVEAGGLDPTIETYVRLAAAIGADFTARLYPNTGPPIRDRHQARMADLLLSALGSRWQRGVEVAVHRPARGWIDLVLHDPGQGVLVATELESTLRRIEQLIRWSTSKAESLPSAAGWAAWSRGGTASPGISRLLVVRWSRANRDAVRAAARLLDEAYPADPRDALAALTGAASWPGPAFVWAWLDGRGPRLLDGRAAW